MRRGTLGSTRPGTGSGTSYLISYLTEIVSRARGGGPPAYAPPPRGNVPRRPGTRTKSRRRGDVHRRFRELGQALVGLLLFLQGRIQQRNRIPHTELLGPLFQRAVAGDFVVLDGFRCGNPAGIPRLRTLVFVPDRFALAEDALDRLAGFGARRFVHQF